MLIKDQAKQIIDKLPDEATLSEIVYALYVRDKFERGERQIRDGLGIEHEQLKREISQGRK